MTRLVGFAIAVVLATALAGCGNDYETKHEVAMAVSEALCHRLAECDLLAGQQENDCVSELVRALCPDATCNSAPSTGNERIDECIDALTELSCTAEELPAECYALF